MSDTDSDEMRHELALALAEMAAECARCGYWPTPTALAIHCRGGYYHAPECHAADIEDEAAALGVAPAEICDCRQPLD